MHHCNPLNTQPLKLISFPDQLFICKYKTFISGKAQVNTKKKNILTNVANLCYINGPRLQNI